MKAREDGVSDAFRTDTRTRFSTSGGNMTRTATRAVRRGLTSHLGRNRLTSFLKTVLALLAAIGSCAPVGAIEAHPRHVGGRADLRIRGAGARRERERRAAPDPRAALAHLLGRTRRRRPADPAHLATAGGCAGRPSAVAGTAAAASRPAGQLRWYEGTVLLPSAVTVPAHVAGRIDRATGGARGLARLQRRLHT